MVFYSFVVPSFDWLRNVDAVASGKSLYLRARSLAVIMISNSNWLTKVFLILGHDLKIK